MLNTILRARGRQTAKRVVFEDYEPESLKILRRIERDLATVAPRFTILTDSLRQFAVSKLSERKNFVIGVVSPNPGEGRTTVSLILASALAEIHGSAIYVETPQVNKVTLQEETAHVPTMGLAGVDETDTSLQSAILQTGKEGLSILPAGAQGERLFPLRRIDLVSKVIGHLRQQFDVTVVDLPPLLASDDALGLIRAVDSVVLVVAAGKTNLPEVFRSADLCAGLPIDGVIINGFTRRVPRLLSTVLTSEGQMGLE